MSPARKPPARGAAPKKKASPPARSTKPRRRAEADAPAPDAETKAAKKPRSPSKRAKSPASAEPRESGSARPRRTKTKAPTTDTADAHSSEDESSSQALEPAHADASAASRGRSARSEVAEPSRNGSAPSWPPFPGTNFALAEKVLVRFVRDEVTRVGLRKVVVGLSGGVDSACAAAIAARALGPENVLAVNMPYRSSSPASARDANTVARALGIDVRTIEITAQIDAYFATQPDASKERRGNKMARERMTILYDMSAAEHALVLGTSNKTELLLGYGTLYGDMASALNPIGDLYKTQIWGLAAHVEVPRDIVEKAPSADLWEGQTDESELGFGYRDVDALLYRMVDERWSDAELTVGGFDAGLLARVRTMIRASQFKRRLPLIAKISERTIDADFRYPRDWGT